MKRFILLGLLFIITACVNTRDPQYISIDRDGDNKRSCKELEVEYTSNTEIATPKISKNKHDDKRDIFLGALIWPGLADFKNADGIEGNGFLDRNIRIIEIAKSKSCNISAWPTQPARYK
jgi:hypothetical protein